MPKLPPHSPALSPKPSPKKSAPKFRTERDSMGELRVPASALWRAQTQRAIDNFPVSGRPMPAAFVSALALVKRCAAEANVKLGALPPATGRAIVAAADRVIAGDFAEHFPVDVYQTGSGTSSNMNMNEVLATLASRAAKVPVDPNDHVNMSQSSNDAIPTAVHVSAVTQIRSRLIPAMTRLAKTIERKAKQTDKHIKTGRTHLMDAMPVRMSQELGAWALQTRKGIARVRDSEKRLLMIAQGGTAVGTGVNADPRFAAAFARALSAQTGARFRPNESFLESLSAQDAAVEMSGQLRVFAVSVMKIANDLRWMNSGPLAGLGEIELPALQPGSSIMPGKVNPVAAESACMVAARVIGNDAAITIAGQSGNFQLNVMLPLVADALLESVALLSSACDLLADKAIAGFRPRPEAMRANLARNPILVTALNPLIGYARAAEIAKKAYRDGRAIVDAAAEETGMARAELEKILDPAKLTRGGKS